MSLRITIGHLTAKWSHNMQEYKHPCAIYLLSPTPPPLSATCLGDSVSEG